MIRASFFVFIACLSLASCATGPEHHPLKHSSQEIAQKIKIIALLEIQIPSDIGRQEEVRADFESEITQELQEGGFKVIPSREWRSVYDRMVADIGGIFDPTTGKADEKKSELLRNLVFREMIAKHAVDAFCRPSLKIAKARWAGNKAQWHGTSESTTGQEGFWASMDMSNVYGTVGALSLEIVIFGADGNIFYDHFGGIQLLSRLERDGAFGGREFKAVAAHQLLSDSTRNRNAVRIALGPLLGRSGSEP